MRDLWTTTRRSIFATTLILLVASNGDGREMSLPIVRSAVISDGDVHRILLAVGDESRLSSTYIEDAHLAFDLPVDVTGLPLEPLEVQVYGIASDWDAAVTWRYGWDRPGGDVDEDVFARSRIRFDREDGKVRVPVGDVLRQSVQGGGLHGLLLTVAPYHGRGLTASQAALLANAVSAEVEVKWSPRPPESPRRQRALQGS
jgi:hypothetical protein